VIVVDTNAIAYLLLGGEGTAQARAAFLADADWVAPLLWRSEFRNVLAMHLRRGRLTLADALLAMREAETLLAGSEYLVESERVLGLAASSKCSAYDCEFVALAEQLGVPLVTSDEEVLAAFPKVAVSPGKFVGAT
jgi:predicted nucleic acid-binding protein